MPVPIGRFAPSPTGNLHLGSLTTAIASYCHIKSIGGLWLVRMEDTDYQRCNSSFSQNILKDLRRLGLQWDRDVVYQSHRTDIYNHYLHSHADFQSPLKHLSYACECSRKKLHANLIYPRYCLHKSLPTDKHKLRIQLPNYSLGFLDCLQGMQWQNPQQTLGDVVLRRSDGMINYFLAVSVDDGLQGVTHVMRGLDILPLTCAQIAIMQYLNLPAVEHWYHLPLVYNKQGQKLSKQNLAKPIDTSTPLKCSLLINKALSLLSQSPVALNPPEQMLDEAVAQWSSSKLRYQTKIRPPQLTDLDPLH